MSRLTPLHAAKPGALIRRYYGMKTAESTHKTLDALVGEQVQPLGATAAITGAPSRSARKEAIHD